LSARSLQEARGFGAESVQKRENFVAIGRRFGTLFLDIFEGYEASSELTSDTHSALAERTQETF
jgi:hypothetical protein